MGCYSILLPRCYTTTSFTQHILCPTVITRLDCGIFGPFYVLPNKAPEEVRHYHMIVSVIQYWTIRMITSGKWEETCCDLSETKFSHWSSVWIIKPAWICTTWRSSCWLMLDNIQNREPWYLIGEIQSYIEYSKPIVELLVVLDNATMPQCHVSRHKNTDCISKMIVLSRVLSYLLGQGSLACRVAWCIHHSSSRVVGLYIALFPVLGTRLNCILLY